MIAPPALFLAASALLRQLSLWAASGAGLSDAQLNAAAASVASVLLAPAALYWWRRERKVQGDQPAVSPAIPVRTALISVAVGLALGFASLPAYRGLGGTIAPDAALSGPIWLRLLRLGALCAAGPIGEEAVYRGLVLRRGNSLLGARGGALVSAALFAAAHGPSRMLPLDFVAGLVFSGPTLRQRRPATGQWSLLAPTLCHAAANAAMVLGTILL